MIAIRPLGLVLSCLLWLASVQAADTQVLVPSPVPAWKPWLDKSVILLTAPLFLPVIGATAVAIAVFDGQPVIFTQTRLGKDGEPFIIYKFRTMRVDAAGSPFTQLDDERVTRLGRWLRKHHLDELPQFWNVLRGEMSIVGPRPHNPETARVFAAGDPNYHLRFVALPGITGPAQMALGQRRGDVDQCPYSLLDVQYVRKPTVWVDLSLMLRSLAVLVFPRPK